MISDNRVQLFNLFQKKIDFFPTFLRSFTSMSIDAIQMKVINIQPLALIQKAVSHDRKAQQELYVQFAPKMLSVCRTYIRDLHHAEDVMITAFAKVFAKLHTFQNQGSFEGWIRRIMVCESLDYLRAQKEFMCVDDDSFFTDSHSDLDVQMDLEDIQYHIDALPNGCKAVFVLYAIEGYKHHEIASMLQISEGTSKSQFHYAKQQLAAGINTDKKYRNGTK